MKDKQEFYFPSVLIRAFISEIFDATTKCLLDFVLDLLERFLLIHLENMIC